MLVVTLLLVYSVVISLSNGEDIRMRFLPEAGIKRNCKKVDWTIPLFYGILLSALEST